MMIRLKPAGLTSGVALAALIPAVIIPGPQGSSAAAVIGGIIASAISGFTLLPALMLRASKHRKRLDR
jgi:Cu/Ag efflux pump CusA